MPRLSVLLRAAALCALLAPAGAALAQQDLPAAREATMKEIAGAARTVGQMVQGRTSYDAAAAKAALETMSAAAERFPDLFPADSGPDGAALPAIWENKADFEARAMKLSADATAAANATGGGVEALKTAFARIGRSCGGCHELYRAPSP
ncbi:c-type cytochrome [Prosthecomicrobium pneumaticum]|uniref:Cytochrome c556 n=1 Tax=Prosthecomicrobium pneumaticum TaxID=81895 RepID=A0A7W9CU69_9HYPH|nr:cytochrome c [Prosthecomicrobium pneumaticum]MBB5751729.1 cytochrome c556 [Prosthecomicrobium pneumaticum]